MTQIKLPIINYFLKDSLNRASINMYIGLDKDLLTIKINLTCTATRTASDGIRPITDH